MKELSKHWKSNWAPMASLLITVACSGSASLGGGGAASVGGATQSNTGGTGNSVGGTVSSGGHSASSGGKPATGGNAGVGGADCNTVQCLRAYECVAYCGGPVLSSGCCPCGNGTIDRVTACSGAGGNAATGGATGTTVYQPCAGKACGDLCTLCAPNDANCGETAVIKQCNATGQCLAGSQVCSPTGSGGKSSTGGAPATGGNRNTGGSKAGTGGASGVTCGSATCGAGEYCCNASCSLCAPTGGACIAMVCLGTGGASSTGGASGVGGATSIAGLHSSCVNGACPTGSGLTPVSYYGIAGPSGPLFCNCEIPCSTDATGSKTCPTNMRCITIADGPGDVCAFTDASGNGIWP